MNELSLPQRAIRPVLNFLVERFFPKGAFYGEEYLRPFEKVSSEDKTTLGAAAMFLQSKMRQAGGDGMSIEMIEVTFQGEPVGSWELSLNKLADKEIG